MLGEYKGSKIKVKLRCNKDHEYNVIPSNFKTGKRCPKCSNRCPIQAKEMFIKLLNQEGYELIGEYKNAMTKVKIKCNKGHEYKVKPNNFKSGQRCSVCSNKCPIQAKEQFIHLLNQEGYELIGEYKGVMIKVKIRCSEGHEYKVKPNSFKNDQRCPKCSGNCPIQAKEQFMGLLKKEKYKLIGEYKGVMTKVKIRCPEGHLWEVTPNNFKINYRRCPHCAGSTGQRLLQEMLLEYNFGKVIYNDREILDGLELDIYYPELSIGIEYQGNYWHTLPENIVRDKRKKKLCKEKGIELIEVWDDDFLNNPDKITKKLWYKITY